MLQKLQPLADAIDAHGDEIARVRAIQVMFGEQAMSDPHELAQEEREEAEYREFTDFVNDNYNAAELIRMTAVDVLEQVYGDHVYVLLPDFSPPWAGAIIDPWPVSHIVLLDFMRENTLNAYTCLWNLFQTAEENKP